MAGTLSADYIQPQSNTGLTILTPAGGTIASVNIGGIYSATGNLLISSSFNGLVANTGISGLIINDQIASVANTKITGTINVANTNITGNIISSQITSVANTQITGILAAANGGTGNNGGAWTAYTPTISAATGTITTSSATGQYQLIGKTCIVSMTITITTAGTGANQLFATLPFTSAARIQSGTTGAEVNSTGNGVKGYIPTSSTQLQLTYYNNSTPIGSGNVIIVTTTYEIA
jgi:hypothetical protein